MNYEAVCRTAPATPGLLNTNNKKFKLTYWHSICQETSSAEEACEAKLGVNWTIINCALDRGSVAPGQFYLQCHSLTYTLYSCGVLCCTMCTVLMFYAVLGVQWFYCTHYILW